MTELKFDCSKLNKIKVYHLFCLRRKCASKYYCIQCVYCVYSIQTINVIIISFDEVMFINNKKRTRGFTIDRATKTICSGNTLSVYWKLGAKKNDNNCNMQLMINNNWQLMRRRERSQ